MSGASPGKTGPFFMSPENSDHVFTVENDGENYICVVPEPLSQLFGGAYLDEVSAWMAIIQIRTMYPSALQWSVENKARCHTCLWESFNQIGVTSGDIDASWLVFEKGTSVKDIKSWFNAEFDL